MTIEHGICNFWKFIFWTKLIILHFSKLKEKQYNQKKMLPRSLEETSWIPLIIILTTLTFPVLVWTCIKTDLSAKIFGGRWNRVRTCLSPPPPQILCYQKNLPMPVGKVVCMIWVGLLQVAKSRWMLWH